MPQELIFGQVIEPLLSFEERLQQGASELRPLHVCLQLPVSERGVDRSGGAYLRPWHVAEAKAVRMEEAQKPRHELCRARRLLEPLRIAQWTVNETEEDVATPGNFGSVRKDFALEQEIPERNVVNFSRCSSSGLRKALTLSRRELFRQRGAGKTVAREGSAAYYKSW